jgi:hypothetical protein
MLLMDFIDSNLWSLVTIFIFCIRCMFIVYTMFLVIIFALLHSTMDTARLYGLYQTIYHWNLRLIIGIGLAMWN